MRKLVAKLNIITGILSLNFQFELKCKYRIGHENENCHYNVHVIVNNQNLLKTIYYCLYQSKSGTKRVSSQIEANHNISP